MDTRPLRNVFLAVIFGVALALALSALRRLPEGGGPLERQRAERVFRKLGFSPEQIESMHRHRFTQEGMIRQRLAQLKEKIQQVKEELEKRDSDEAALAALSQEMKALQSQIIDLRIQGILEVKKSMTPEQFESFQKEMGLLSR